MSESKQKLVPQREGLEPYTITEAQKEAARKRRRYGEPKKKKQAKA